MTCPKCDKPMEHIDDKPVVNIIGDWECIPCEQFIRVWNVDDGCFEWVENRSVAARKEAKP
jgi:hypothetical protein